MCVLPKVNIAKIKIKQQIKQTEKIKRKTNE